MKQSVQYYELIHYTFTIQRNSYIKEVEDKSAYTITSTVTSTCNTLILTELVEIKKKKKILLTHITD